jgi:hypothetical protein
MYLFGFNFGGISVFIHGLLSLTLVLFCGMCFTADFVIVSLKTFHILVTWQTGDQNTKEKYNQLKHHTQKITRQSYWKYIENIVTPKEEEPHTGMKKVLDIHKTLT